jgi:hypothetical protein
MADKGNSPQERRRYIRLNSVFPVQFRIILEEKTKETSDLLQGFTSNISRGGICLEVNNLNPKLVAAIKTQHPKLLLEIDLPLRRKMIKAKASIAWVSEILINPPNKYLLGLSYDQIGREENSLLIRYAWMRKISVPLSLSIIVLLFLAFSINSYLNIRLIRGNKMLVEQLVKIVQDSSVAKQKVKQINKEKEDLEVKIQALGVQLKVAQDEKDSLGGKSISQATLSNKKIAELNILINRLNSDKAILQDEMIKLQKKENTVTEELLRLDKKKITLEKANLESMYQWLKIHQNPRSGLVMSFEGDKEIADWAFTYDQSLVAQAYANFFDFERTKKIFEFYSKRAQRENNLFFNAYYVNDGSPAEFTIHAGPNLWLGIAVLQYTKKTQDNTYLKLAEDISTGIIKLQSQDKDGGIKGGPSVEWYSTEHNLDAYAFFNMFYNLTSNSKYAVIRDKVLNWIINNTYNSKEIPVKRGKGDATIATDTYAWSIAAIGPQKLTEIGMNPDKILDFAEQNCSVEVSYIRPEGQVVKIKGFDFAPEKHLGRGGVVSSEWTAQMVMSFKIMANFYYKNGMNAKARVYELKADDYLMQLGNMLISSPSPSGQGQACLPYATQDFVDTGHGWMTPKGKSTGSVAGTTYTLFAYYNYNPLSFDNE